MDETGQVEIERVRGFREAVGMMSSDFSFGEWLSAMEQLQEIAYGAHYDDFSDGYRGDSMMMNLLALHGEISEMGDEMGWKTWASPRGWINREAVIAEAVDAMHFLANLLKHARCTGSELTAAYKAKMLKNLDRQIAGYDVRPESGEKCGYCHRDLSSLDAYGKLQIYQLEIGRRGEGTARIVKFCNNTHARLWDEDAYKMQED